MTVHNSLGPGHREGVYQQALLRQLPESCLEVMEEVPVEIAMWRHVADVLPRSAG